jgi:5-methylcytosine-specific restriction endonuclease McrA
MRGIGSSVLRTFPPSPGVLTVRERNKIMPTLKRRPYKKPQTSERNRIYNTNRWKEYSKLFLKRNRLCVMCIADGKTQVSQVTDHILAIKDGGSEWDPANHQGLCFTHHSIKTAQEKANRRTGSGGLKQ